MMNDKIALLQHVLILLNVSFHDKTELYHQMIPRELLLDPVLVKRMVKQKEHLKTVYHSAMLTCLHANSTTKQRYPAVCMLRQLLKANDMILRPKVESMGYDRNSGKKITKRYYIILPRK